MSKETRGRIGLGGCGMNRRRPDSGATVACHWEGRPGRGSQTDAGPRTGIPWLGGFRASLGRRRGVRVLQVKVGGKERGEIVAPVSHRRPITGPDAVEQEHSTRGRDSAHHESGNHLHLCCILLLRPPETSSHLRNALLNRSRARSRLAACSTIGFGYPFFSAVFPAPRS